MVGPKVVLLSFDHVFSIWNLINLTSYSTNQEQIPERSHQVAQMRKIYENSTRVLIWLGADDSDQPHAKIAVEEIHRISDFLCEKLGISIDSLDEYGDVYHEVIFKNRDKLPLPDQVEFTLDTTWENLIWFYSRPYFSRVWVIQEINANRERLLHCGNEKIIWKRIHLVAGYLMMETAWSKTHRFSSTYIWCVATMSTERVVHSKNWLHVLYLASNFSTMDPRDFIFALQGMFSPKKGAALLRPDYSKLKSEVYRDSVEAAFLDFQKTDVLLYTTGYGNPSWVPEWDKAMLFRNPFRFGKEMPWKPSGDTKPVWRVDRKTNVLSLKGFVVDSIKVAVPYNEGYFGKAMADSKEGREQLKQAWQEIVTIWGSSQSKIPFSRDILTAAATSLSYGLDENASAADEGRLLLNFLAYLKSVLDKETYNKYVPPELTEESKEAKAESFGKPVWDFEYPESSFFVTERNLIGSSTSRNKPGDKVWIALGSTYPLILRPTENQFLLKGFSYVHGIMQGELLPDSKQEVFEIR